MCSATGISRRWHNTGWLRRCGSELPCQLSVEIPLGLANLSDLAEISEFQMTRGQQVLCADSETGGLPWTPHPLRIQACISRDGQSANRRSMVEGSVEFQI